MPDLAPVGTGSWGSGSRSSSWYPARPGYRAAYPSAVVRSACSISSAGTGSSGAEPCARRRGSLHLLVALALDEPLQLVDEEIGCGLHASSTASLLREDAALLDAARPRPRGRRRSAGSVRGRARPRHRVNLWGPCRPWRTSTPRSSGHRFYVPCRTVTCSRMAPPPGCSPRTLAHRTGQTHHIHTARSHPSGGRSRTPRRSPPWCRRHRRERPVQRRSHGPGMPRGHSHGAPHEGGRPVGARVPHA